MDVLRAVEPHVVFKKAHVREALRLLPLIEPRMTAEGFLRVVQQVDEFSALNHSKTKRITAADVEQHLRGMGLLAPVTTSS